MAGRSMVALDKFVEATVKEVIAGVDAIRSRHGERVAPPGAATVKIEGQPAVASHDGTFWTVISFDVAVTASTEKHAEAKVGLKAGLKVLLVGSGSGEFEGSAGASGKSEAVHRVKFAIPIRLSEKAEM